MGEYSGAEKKKVVVVGGGVGGSLIAKILQNHVEIFLIDPKEYFEIPWASLRSMVEPSFAQRSIIKHSEYLSTAHLITSTAVDIRENEIITEEGQSVPFDYLVVATGHSEYGACTMDEKFNFYKTENEKIKSASSIMIIGGGPTGVELAGEIAVDFPEKKVTIVHRGSRLLEFIGERAGKKAFDWLVSKKVEVRLGQSVDLHSASEGVFRTSEGETIHADCHYNCIGKPVGTSWLKGTILRDNLDINGRLMVDSNLRVKNHKNIFGIGDIIDTNELKLGHQAQRHAFVTAKNIRLLLKGAKDNALVIHRPSSPWAVVSLGRRDAVAQFICFSMVGRLPGLLKSADLYVTKTRRQLGLKC